MGYRCGTLSDESKKLLKRLKKQYLKPRDDLSTIRYQSKTALHTCRLFEEVLAHAYIKDLKCGENLTEKDWEEDLKNLYDHIWNCFYGAVREDSENEN